MDELFGTDGIRTRMGAYPLTPLALVQLGQAIGHWAIQRSGKPRIAVAYDTRNSSSLCAAALKTGLLQYPITINDCGILPTPVLFNWTHHQDYDLGIMITASHNPADDNGIKIFTHDAKLSEADQALITDFFHHAQHTIDYANLGAEKCVHDLSAWYQKHISSFFEPHFLHGAHIVLDCAYGATAHLAPALFTDWGARVTALHTQPTGRNINARCGAVFPETLKESVIALQADLGCAFDGDGDRLVIVTKDGTILDGDHILALLNRHPAYAHEKHFVSTVMSNEGLAHYCKIHNKELLQTPVGDKYVIAKLKEQGALLGAEPSGHIICADFAYTADALFAAARVAHTAVLKGDWVFETFKKFPQVTVNIPVTHKKDLEEEPLRTVIDHYKKSLPMGQVLVRYSGTEPLLRVMVQAPDQVTANQLSQALCHELRQALMSQKHYG